MRDMKPAFALDFRDETFGLLHRTGAGWTQIGTVALDDPDLAQGLGYFRSTALGLSPRGISTKLIIPNDQILYLTVTAPGPDAAKRRAQIAVALEGRTPYDVADLVFDWSGSGADVQVAVIARETLGEAAAFAAEHRFNPISFVAVPDEGTFKGEPWFGPTDLAAELLAPGEKVDRDKVAVAIILRAPTQSPAPVAQPKADAVAVAAPAVPATTALAQEPNPITALPSDLATDPLPRPAPTEPFIDLPSFRAEDAPTRQSQPGVSLDPLPPISAAEPTDPPETLSFAQIMAEARAAQPPVAPPEPEEAPMALDVGSDDADDAPALAPVSVLDARIDDDLPPPPSATVAFSTRRQSGDDAAFGKPDALPILGSAFTAKPVARPLTAKPIPTSGSGFDRGANPLPVARPAVAAAPPRAPATAKPSAAGKALRGLSALVTAPGIAGSKPRKAPVPQIAGASQSQSLPFAKSTVPVPPPARVPPPRAGIGLGGKQAPVRGKPRYLGLALTLLLLLCLAAVAAWSSFSLSAWNAPSAPADATAESLATDPPSAADDIPAPEDEMAADMQDPADFAPDGGDLAADLPAADADLPQTELAADLPPPPAEPAPQTGLIAGDVAGNTPNPEPQDEILLAAMDAPPVAPDPLSLPQPDARGDPQPVSPAAPPPYGTVYKFDANGLIVPTPEGIITPEGVLLIAGKPPLVPAMRPETLAVVPLASAAAADTVTDAPVLPVDPAMVGKRSKPRPPTLAPPASADDDAALAPAADSRFAGLRPRLRPATVLAAGEAERLASAGASLVAVAEPDAGALVLAASRSPMAVAISRKPEPRPRDLSRAVEAAVAAAVRAPEPVPEPEQETAAAAPEKNTSPEADNEPELASAAPSIPTKASVAKQATFKNAINLSKINLIGVYGTQSSRYALVRQANGRYKKVAVGDRLDGGQIAAITATEVRYKKGSKMVTLAMPKS